MKIYLDGNATTPVDPRVVEVMGPYWTTTFGNPSSLHGFGRDAEDAVALAREQVARSMGARSEEIVFTSGGTEANDLAIAGTLAASGDRRHLVTTAIEHPSVIETVKALASEPGCEFTLVRPDRQGRVDAGAIRAAIRPDTALVSVMAVNNETGAIQPVAEISSVCRDLGVPFHCDAVQAPGKIPFDVNSLGVDLVSLSAHKVHGPKGVGALRIGRGVRLRARLHGGEQQRGRRAGTLPVPLIVGFGEAARLAQAEAPGRDAIARDLGDRLLRGLEERIEGIRLNGPREERVPHCVNAMFPGAPGDALLMQLDQAGIAVSTGSACASGSPTPSHVLLAMGLSRNETSSSLRLSLTSWTTRQEIDHVLDTLPDCVARLRRIRPGRPHR